MRARVLFSAALPLLVLAACTNPPPQPSGLRLTKVGFAQLPQWNPSDASLASFQHSCAVLMTKPDATPMGGAGYAGTVADWRAVCEGANNGDARNFFEKNFTP